MRFTLVAGLIISAVTTAGCGGGGMHIDPEAKPVSNRWNATLATPAGLAGALQVTGTGWMGSDPKKPTETQAVQWELAEVAAGGDRTGASVAPNLLSPLRGAIPAAGDGVRRWREVGANY